MMAVDMIEKRAELRKRLSNVLPTELNTDFQLDRWLESNNNNIETCTRNFLEYLQNRRALGFDTTEAISKFYSNSKVIRFHKTFKVSRLDGNWINEQDNGVVFVEMGIGNPNKVMQEFSVGEYLEIFFGYCEYFQHCILQQEKRTGRRSHGICIFDMQPMNLFHYANPYAPINRLLQGRIHVWMTYYSELLKKIVIVNPPRFLGPLFKMMSVLLPERMISRFIITATQPNDIQKHIARSAIPKRYGGERSVDDMNYEPIDVFTTNDLQDIQLLSRKYGLKSYNSEEFNILPSESFKRNYTAKLNQKLFIEYISNREMEISLLDENHNCLIPRLKFSTPVIPERQSIRISKDCQIQLEIKNLSILMKMKLKISVCFI